MGVSVYSSSIVFAASSLSHSSLALVWCASHRISLHKLLQCGFLKILLHCGFFSWSAVPQEQITPALLSCRTTFPYRNQVSVWALLHGVLPASWYHAGSLQATVPSKLYLTAPVWAPSQAAGEFLLPCGPAGLTCATIFQQSLQENLCCVAWSTSSPSYFTDLDAFRAFSHISSHVSPICCCAVDLLK